jgi:hypothetical protein
MASWATSQYGRTDRCRPVAIPLGGHSGYYIGRLSCAAVRQLGAATLRTFSNWRTLGSPLLASLEVASPQTHPLRASAGDSFAAHHFDQQPSDNSAHVIAQATETSRVESDRGTTASHKRTPRRCSLKEVLWPTPAHPPSLDGGRAAPSARPLGSLAGTSR